MLSGCGSGGNDEVTTIESIVEIPPDTPDLVLAMESASLTNSIDFYLLPDSDDFENIPQDPMNPITAERVEVGKFIYHDPAFATEGVALRAKTWSCASCHNSRAVFKCNLPRSV
jgi:cytochrome c peroxidase